MKLHHTFALALATAFLWNAAPAAAKALSPGESFSGEVIYVVDGDSIPVQTRKNRPAVKVDLAGVEAKRGSGARMFLGDLVHRKVVDVRVISTEGGLRARVFLDGKDLAAGLVEADLARETGASVYPIRRLRGFGRLTQVFLGGRSRS